MYHVNEMKTRVGYIILNTFLIFIISYLFSDELFYIIAKPLIFNMSEGELVPDNNKRLIYTNIAEAFLTQIELAFYLTTYISLPYLLYQTWSFIKPGLYSNEKVFVKRMFLPSITLFVISIILAYQMLIPAICAFFSGFETNSEQSLLLIQLEPKISEYVSTVLSTLSITIIVSQYPVIILILVHLELISYMWLVRKRKAFILSFFILGALITPPDVISQIILATILLVFYEVILYLVILYINYTNQLS